MLGGGVSHFSHFCHSRYGWSWKSMTCIAPLLKIGWHVFREDGKIIDGNVADSSYQSTHDFHFRFRIFSRWLKKGREKKIELIMTRRSCWCLLFWKNQSLHVKMDFEIKFEYEYATQLVARLIFPSPFVGSFCDCSAKKKLLSTPCLWLAFSSQSSITVLGFGYVIGCSAFLWSHKNGQSLGMTFRYRTSYLSIVCSLKAGFR